MKVICQALSLYVIIVAFKASVIDSEVMSIVVNVTTSLSDALLFVFIGVVLGLVWKPLFLLPIITITLLIYANIIYWRNFSDVIPPGFYKLSPSFFNEFVVVGTVSSVHFYDLLWFCPLAFSIVIYCHEGHNKMSLRNISILLGCIIVTSIFTFGVQLRRFAIYCNENSIEGALRDLKSNWDVHCDWSSKILHFNLTGYVVKIVEYLSTDSQMRLDKREIDKIIDDLCHSSESEVLIVGDARFAGNCGKNLIFIEVESLSSAVIDLPYAKYIVPTLINLITDSSSIYADMQVLAGPGRSADGQFIHNTGLLSLKEDVLVNDFALADYPSIAKSLPDEYNSLEIICENRTLWSHGLTSKSYGFDYLLDDITSKSKLNQDSIMFDAAAAILKNYPQPFYAFLTTISSHDPYDMPKVTLVQEYDEYLPDDMAINDKNYLMSLIQFDKSLARFLESMRQNGIYNRSIIVITGDHEPRQSCISEIFHSTKVPLIIANSGTKLNLSQYSEVISQADVFPTILDVMAITSYIKIAGDKYEWRGFGNSLVRGEYKLPGERQWKMSEQIIRGRLCGPLNGRPASVQK